MVESSVESHSDPLAGLKGLSWLVGAAALSVAAGWGAYYWLGDIETPLHKVAVVAAALAGFGVAVWLKRIVQLVLVGGIIVLVLWAANYYWFHK